MRQPNDHITTTMKQCILECFRRMNKPLDRCWLCNKPTTKLDIHHTKYNGATIHDLQLVCRKCNTQQHNRYLD